MLNWKQILAWFMLGVMFIPAPRVWAGEEPLPAYKKIIFLGGAVTRIGPSESLGWSGDWGMAASARDKDYAHLFVSKLASSQKGAVPEALFDGKGGRTLSAAAARIPLITDFQPDLVIVQLGIDDDLSLGEEEFQRSYEEILKAIREEIPHARVLCPGIWWPPNGSVARDALIHAACRKFGATFVDLNAANFDPANKTEAENRFRCPGDKGMAAIADALWLALTHDEKGSSANPETPLPPTQTSSLLEENWDRGSVLKWQPSPCIKPDGEKPLVFFQGRGGAGDSVIQADLPLEEFKGRWFTVETRVKGEGISEKPADYNGIKLMLHLKKPGDVEDWVQPTLPVGTFDWKEVHWKARIPDNVISAQLVIGLEKVTGNVWFDKIKIIADQ